MEALRSQIHSKCAPNGETIETLVRVGRSLRRRRIACVATRPTW